MALSEKKHHTSRGQRKDMAGGWVRDAPHGQIPGAPTPQPEFFQLFEDEEEPGGSRPPCLGEPRGHRTRSSSAPLTSSTSYPWCRFSTLLGCWGGGSGGGGAAEARRAVCRAGYRSAHGLFGPSPAFCHSSSAEGRTVGGSADGTWIRVLRHERLTVAMLLVETTHHAAPRGQTMASSGEWVRGEAHGQVPEELTPQEPGTQHFFLDDDSVPELGSSRPDRLPVVSGPQERVQRHTVDQMVDAPGLPTLDVPVPQMVDVNGGGPHLLRQAVLCRAGYRSAHDRLPPQGSSAHRAP